MASNRDRSWTPPRKVVARGNTPTAETSNTEELLTPNSEAHKGYEVTFVSRRIIEGRRKPRLLSLRNAENPEPKRRNVELIQKPHGWCLVAGQVGSPGDLDDAVGHGNHGREMLQDRLGRCRLADAHK